MASASMRKKLFCSNCQSINAVSSMHSRSAKATRWSRAPAEYPWCQSCWSWVVILHTPRPGQGLVAISFFSHLRQGGAMACRAAIVVKVHWLRVGAYQHTARKALHLLTSLWVERALFGLVRPCQLIPRLVPLAREALNLDVRGIPFGG